MPVGIPGGGIGGLYYLVLVAAAPVREIPRVLAGRSSAARWRHMGRMALFGGGIVGVLWAEYRAIERIELWLRSRAPRGDGPPGDFGRALDSLAPNLVAVPFVILGAVRVFVQVLRLWVRIADGRAVAAESPPGRGSRT